MGREVIVKPFIHFFIGDTEGHNKWLGHYQSSQPGTSRPYRDCHCSFAELNAPNPKCTYTLASEFRRWTRLVDNNQGLDQVSKERKKTGLAKLKSISRHYIHNALYQSNCHFQTRNMVQTRCVHRNHCMCWIRALLCTWWNHFREELVGGHSRRAKQSV